MLIAGRWPGRINPVTTIKEIDMWLQHGLLLSALMLVSALADAADASLNAMVADVTATSRNMSLTSSQRASRIEDSYERWRRLDHDSLKGMSEADLRALFLAGYITVYHTGRAEHLDDLYFIRGILLAKHEDVRVETDYLYKSLIKLRRFDEAFRVAGSSKITHEPIPTVNWAPTSKGAVPMMVPSSDGGSLNVESFKLRSDYTVIVVSHPLCHFSRNASHDVTADRKMAGLLNNHVLWIEPPGPTLAMKETLKWRGELSGQPVALMYSQSDWPLFPSFDTPTFYVFRGNTLIGTKEGWVGSPDIDQLKTLVMRAAAR